jgi:hypothetical protein
VWVNVGRHASQRQTAARTRAVTYARTHTRQHDTSPPQKKDTNLQRQHDAQPLQGGPLAHRITRPVVPRDVEEADTHVVPPRVVVAIAVAVVVGQGAQQVVYIVVRARARAVAG